jgi:hypothetical protein
LTSSARVLPFQRNSFGTAHLYIFILFYFYLYLYFASFSFFWFCYQFLSPNWSIFPVGIVEPVTRPSTSWAVKKTLIPSQE